MEHQKILNLLNEASDSKFVTRKWSMSLINVHDQSNASCDVGNKIICNKEILKSNLCDYNDVYILVKNNITIAGRNLATEVAFKNFASFTKCIPKIDGRAINLTTEDLSLVMPMYNLIEYSSNYSENTESLWFHSKDEATNFNNDNENYDKCKSFKY